MDEKEGSSASLNRQGFVFYLLFSFIFSILVLLSFKIQPQPTLNSIFKPYHKDNNRRIVSNQKAGGNHLFTSTNRLYQACWRVAKAHATAIE